MDFSVSENLENIKSKFILEHLDIQKSIQYDPFIFITDRELKQFLDIIQVPQSKTLSLYYLDRLITQTLETYFWHNTTLLTAGKRPPTLDEIKFDMLKGKGGPCSVMNTFFGGILSKLGFTSWFLPASIHKPNCHVTIVCKISSRYYFVDIGNQAPYYHAMEIPIQNPDKNKYFSMPDLDFWVQRTPTGFDVMHVDKIFAQSQNHKKKANSVKKIQIRKGQSILWKPVFFQFFHAMIFKTRNQENFSPFLSGIRAVRFVKKHKFRLRNGVLVWSGGNKHIFRSASSLLKLSEVVFPHLDIESALIYLLHQKIPWVVALFSQNTSQIAHL